MTTISVKVASSFWPYTEFWLFLCGQLLSIPCYFFVIYHLLAKKQTRKALHNHAIVVMLLFNFTHLIIDLSMTMSYMRLGYVPLFSPAMCLLQQFVDYGIWYGAIFIMLWTAIERHILIFHSTTVATVRGRLLFHYVPLTVFALYAPVLYFYFVFIYPCDRIFSITLNMCGSLCYRSKMSLGYFWYETTVNYIIPILLILVFDLLLIGRSIVQKQHFQRADQWRRHRKMIIQLMLVSAVYLLCDLPYIIVIIIRWSGYPTFGYGIVSPYITHLTYVPALFLPYSALVTLPKLKEKFRTMIIRKKNRRAVGPLIPMA